MGKLRVTNKMIVDKLLDNQHITPENISQMDMEEAYSAIREDAGIVADHYMHLNNRVETIYAAYAALTGERND